MKYRDYVIKRLLFVIPILFGVSFITWFLSDMSGDPVAAYIGDPMHLTEEEIEAIRIEYGLDQPWYIRFSKHFTHLVQGDLGTTGLHFGYRPVIDVIAGYLPPTIELGLISMMIAIGLGIPLGIISAIKKDQRTDKVARGAYLVGYSIPVYYLGMIISYIIFQTTFELGVGLNDRSLIGTVPYEGRYNSYVFSYPSHIFFGLFPSTGLLLIDSLLTFNPFLFIDASFRILLPGSVIAISQIAIISKMTRMAMIETMKEDYILLARAKGLPDKIVIYKHALRNAILPTLTIGSLVLATLLTGTVLIETVFGWPGLGSFLVRSLNFLDMASVQGFVLITTLLYVMINLIVDLLYGFIDPRIREKMT